MLKHPKIQMDALLNQSFNQVGYMKLHLSHKLANLRPALLNMLINHPKIFQKKIQNH